MSGRPLGRDVTVPLLPLEIHTPCPPQPLPSCPYAFHNMAVAPSDGPAAFGGDFEPSTITAAYGAGAFPWPHGDEELLWFSPDPRAIIPIGGLYVSRRLARTLRQGRFRLTMDADFPGVMAACAARDEGSWITPRLIAGYTRLHALGWAHSIEVWAPGGTLAGGLYGICVGRMFGAESMFHTVTDASKVAMAALMQWAEAEGISLVDVQVLNPHTASMGATEIPRSEYLARLRDAIT